MPSDVRLLLPQSCQTYQNPRRFRYLAVVIDVWSRRVVGWAMGERMTADLVLAALNMALEQRKPKGVIHHSDQGSQYTSLAFGERCRQMQVRPSMGTAGDAMTTQSQRASSSCSSESAFADRSIRRAMRPGPMSSTTSRCSITPGVATTLLATCRR